ncbi:MAG: hypothetical protein RL346_1342 [Verrucomicrobiota bacterium]|jgi:KDO2-lipid IV(A) lauroyltransferase
MVAGSGKRVSWRIEAMGHSLVAFLTRLLPAGHVFRIGELLGGILWPMIKSRKRIIIRNLRIACAPVAPAQAETMARDSFVRSVANLLSSSISSSSRGGRLEEMLVVENPQVMADAVAQGRGVVLLLAHMGNWELLTRLNHFFPKGVKSGALYRPLNNPILNKRVLRMREADGTRLFSKRDSLHQIGGFLRENGVIGILADQRVGRQGDVIPFFGRLTTVSPLPSLLARRCGSEVLALSLKTMAPGKWSARYHRVEKPYHSANCMKALEEAMQVSLPDVFWLQERWKIYFRKNITPKTWFKDEALRGRKPHRAIYWIGENEGEPEIPEGFTHGDIEWEFVRGKSCVDLGTIDRSKSLPIDFIMISARNEELLRVAGGLEIPVLLSSR